MKYVKRPIPVEAFLWDGRTIPGVVHSIHELVPDGQVGGCIDTLEGHNLKIRSGEHYILGPSPAGEYWPVRKDLFEDQYDVAPDGPLPPHSSDKSTEQ